LHEALELKKKQTTRRANKKKCSMSCKIQQYNDWLRHPDIHCPAIADYHESGQDATMFHTIRERLEKLGLGEVIPSIKYLIEF